MRLGSESRLEADYLHQYVALSGGLAVNNHTVQFSLFSEIMVSTSALLGGALLVAAGVFQWTPLKRRCLNHCRSPLTFLQTEWREGKTGAFIMGIRHGAYCVGCCWRLMILLFVAGVMNLTWVALISIFVLIEKVAPAPAVVSRVTGVLLAAVGLWMMF